MLYTLSQYDPSKGYMKIPSIRQNPKKSIDFCNYIPLGELQVRSHRVREQVTYTFGEISLLLQMCILIHHLYTMIVCQRLYLLPCLKQRTTSKMTIPIVWSDHGFNESESDKLFTTQMHAARTKHNLLIVCIINISSKAT